MADPIIANGVRALTVIHGPSDLPEDVFVNSWAFTYDDSVETYETAIPTIQNALEGFFVEATSTLSAVMDFMPQYLGALTIKTYDLSTTPPRIPTEVEAALWNPTLTAALLPQEVAICASFYSLQNLPRNRGRVYVGPLAGGQATDALGQPIPSANLIDTLAAASLRLAELSFATDGIKWGVLSQTDATIKPITNGWVDNAWDTQRRRGIAATARDTWEAQ